MLGHKHKIPFLLQTICKITLTLRTDVIVSEHHLSHTIAKHNELHVRKGIEYQTFCSLNVLLRHTSAVQGSMFYPLSVSEDLAKESEITFC